MINKEVLQNHELFDVNNLTYDDVKYLLLTKLAMLSQLDKEKIALDVPIFDLGLSSIILVELNFYIKEKLGTEIPIAFISEETTLDDMSQALYDCYSKNAKQQDKFILNKNLAESDYKIDKLACYYQVQMHDALLQRAHVKSPYFRPHETVPSATSIINGKEYINFASYNYLDLCGHLAVSQAAKDAIDQYGTSASSSRIVSGERPIHRQLEKLLAKTYGTDDAMVLVSGHATNVTTIGHLLGRHDLILCDKLSHNSINQGAQLSRAKRISFAHNDMQALEKLLKQHRNNYKKVLIVTEGLFSMDGDFPPLPQLIALKKKYKCFLMIDEAHSFGVLGETGRGIAEHFNVDVNDVDIWMGTLSKTLGSCGGYLAGNSKLIEYLRYKNPGFMYSVGMAPPLAAASHAAIQVMLQEPERVKSLVENSQYFCRVAKEMGFDTGHAQGYAVVPVIVGKSINALKIGEALYEQGVDAQAIIYPAVAEDQARIRFFISSAHTKAHIDYTLQVLAAYQETISCKVAKV